MKQTNWETGCIVLVSFLAGIVFFGVFACLILLLIGSA